MTAPPHPEDLLARLREAEETLEAIRKGDVDAVVVGGPAGQRVYTLDSADRPYRVLVERMQEGALTLTGAGLILYANARFAELAATDRETLAGASIDRFFHGPHRDAVHALLASSGTAGASAELAMSTTGGAELPVNLSLVHLDIEDDGLRLICGIVTDLSLVRGRSAELAAANARLATEIEERRRIQGSLQLALDAAGMGSWDLDLRTNVALRSPRHDALFGYPAPIAAWQLETALARFVPEDRPAVAEAFATSLRTGALDFEARITRADDNATRWLHVAGRTFYEDHVPTRIAGIVADVTERRAVEERLRQAQKIEAIGLLTGGVAHDFNNLLMVISSGLDLVKRQGLTNREGADPARQDRIFAGMRQAVQRGSGLSRQLLAFARRQHLQPEPVDLVRQVGGMQELLDRSLRGDVHVRTDLQPGLWPVEVDAGELELVLLNLAVNARDAMPEGGAITIHAENAPALQDPELSGDFVRLSVVDEGTGMPPEVASRAFEPFFTTKEVGKGSGLGLAQTHGFARSSGGAARIRSAPGQGTTVTLFLPRTTKTPAPVADRPPVMPEPHSLPPGAAGQVLLVEDDPAVAAFTAEMIQHLGYTTTRVGTAEAALGVLASGCLVDLVFSDVMMPGAMNGVDLARAIRTSRPGLPVLLTSGYAEAARIAAGAEGLRILPKPFRLEELAAAFETVRPRV